MYSTAVAVSALLAATQVLAAPTAIRNDARSLSAIEGVVHDIFGRDAAAVEARSIDAIGNAIGSFAEDVLGPHFGKRDADARSLSAIEGVISDIFNKRGEELDARSLTAIGNFISGIFNKRDEPLDARSLTAIGNFISGIFNKRGESGLMVDTETGTIYMDVPDSTGKRSLKAVGTAVAGGIASGVAGAVAGDIFNKREPASGLMIDTDTGVIYADVPDSADKRSLKAVGTAIAGGAASLLTGAVLNNKRGESGLMVDTETGVLYMDVPDANEGRSLKAVGTAVAGGIASGVAGAVAGDIFNKRASGLMVDTETGTLYMDVPDAVDGRSLRAVGAAVAGGVASGVAGAVAGDLLGSRAIPSAALMVDTETGTIYMDTLDANEARSLSAIEGVISDIFDKRAIDELE